MNPTQTPPAACGHTPGPWRYCPASEAVWSDARPDKICKAFDTCEEDAANARLIAAAPALLAALEPFAELCDSAKCADMGEHEAASFVISAESMRRARAALALAKGDA